MIGSKFMLMNEHGHAMLLTGTRIADINNFLRRNLADNNGGSWAVSLYGDWHRAQQHQTTIWAKRILTLPINTGIRTIKTIETIQGAENAETTEVVRITPHWSRLDSGVPRTTLRWTPPTMNFAMFLCVQEVVGESGKINTDNVSLTCLYKHTDAEGFTSIRSGLLPLANQHTNGSYCLGDEKRTINTVDNYDIFAKLRATEDVMLSSPYNSDLTNDLLDEASKRVFVFDENFNQIPVPDAVLGANLINPGSTIYSRALEALNVGGDLLR